MTQALPITRIEVTEFEREVRDFGSVETRAIYQPGTMYRRKAYAVRIETAPGPCALVRNAENLPFLSTLLTWLSCSWANSRPPSLVPAMPSAFSLPCQTRVHLAPSAITPGMAVTVTSFAGAGWGKVRGC